MKYLSIDNKIWEEINFYFKQTKFSEDFQRDFGLLLSAIPASVQKKVLDDNHMMMIYHNKPISEFLKKDFAITSNLLRKIQKAYKWKYLNR